MAGRLGWRAGWDGRQGRVAGREGGWPVGMAVLVVGGEWIFREKNVLRLV